MTVTSSVTCLEAVDLLQSLGYDQLPVVAEGALGVWVIPLEPNGAPSKRRSFLNHATATSRQLRARRRD